MIAIPLALVAYGVTWLIDRRQRPALVAGGAGGVAGAILSLALAFPV
ncbi:membrane protein [Microbacterium phage Zooman]|nr:membrane protein [Microbacterium phage Zooman]